MTLRVVTATRPLRKRDVDNLLDAAKRNKDAGDSQPQQTYSAELAPHYGLPVGQGHYRVVLVGEDPKLRNMHLQWEGDSSVKIPEQVVKPKPKSTTPVVRRKRGT